MRSWTYLDFVVFHTKKKNAVAARSGCAQCGFSNGDYHCQQGLRWRMRWQISLVSSSSLWWKKLATLCLHLSCTVWSHQPVSVWIGRALVCPAVWGPHGNSWASRCIQWEPAGLQGGLALKRRSRMVPENSCISKGWCWREWRADRNARVQCLTRTCIVGCGWSIVSVEWSTETRRP